MSMICILLHVVYSQKTLYDFTMKDENTIDKLSKVVHFQYSWPEKKGPYTMFNPDPKYFKMVEQGLELNLYPSDKPHQSDSKTLARTEIGFETEILLDDIAYSFSFDHYISMFPKDEFDYSFAQIFGNGGPNVMLRYRGGNYQLMAGGMKSNVAGSPNENIEKWVTWKIDFVLATNNGYVRVYRNGSLFLQLAGNTSGGKSRNHSTVKHGMYSQGALPSSQVQSFTRNLILTSK